MLHKPVWPRVKRRGEKKHAIDVPEAVYEWTNWKRHIGITNTDIDWNAEGLYQASLLVADCDDLSRRQRKKPYPSCFYESRLLLDEAIRVFDLRQNLFKAMSVKDLSQLFECYYYCPNCFLASIVFGRGYCARHRLRVSQRVNRSSRQAPWEGQTITRMFERSYSQVPAVNLHALGGVFSPSIRPHVKNMINTLLRRRLVDYWNPENKHG